MNYYNPNYYMNNYPYMSPPMQQTQPTPTMFPNNQVINNTPTPTQTLNGKIVDSEDVVKATEVPIGGYGIFPKADLSEIYIKSWNNNGTTSVITFKPIIPDPNTPTNNTDLNNILLQKIETLENKLDMFLAQPQQQQSEVPKQTVFKAAEVKNGF